MAIEATTGTGKTSFVMGPLMDWALAETVRVKIPRQMLILCNRRALKADIMAKFEARCKPQIFMNEFGEPDCLAYDIVTIATYQYFEKRLKHTKDKGRVLNSYKIIVLDECHYFFDDASFNENTAAMYQAIKEQEEEGLVVWMTATPENMYSVWMRRGQLKPEHYYKLVRKAAHITRAWIYYKDTELIDIIDRAAARGEKILVMVTKRDKLDSMRALYGDKSIPLSQSPLPVPCKRSSAAPIPFGFRLSVARSRRFALPVTARSALCGFVPLRQSRRNAQRACRIVPAH